MHLLKKLLTLTPRWISIKSCLIKIHEASPADVPANECQCQCLCIQAAWPGTEFHLSACFPPFTWCVSLLRSSSRWCKYSQTCGPLKEQDPWGVESGSQIVVSKMKLRSHCALLERRGLTAATTLGVSHCHQQREGQWIVPFLVVWSRHLESSPWTAATVFLCLLDVF